MVYFFFETYLSAVDRLVYIRLKNGKLIQGIIISFSIIDWSGSNFTVYSWHVVPENCKMTLGFDSFGMIIGEVVLHDDIEEILMVKSNFVFKFN